MQKFKVIMVITGLLLVGFVGGFLTNRYLVEKKVRHFRQLERGQNFGDYFLERISATTEQTTELRPVLDAYGTRFRTLGQAHQKERARLTDSLFNQISPLLTGEQQKHGQRWRRFLERDPDKRKKIGKHKKNKN